MDAMNSELPHGHLWRLADGTGLHAPPAEIAVDPESGRLCCHLCGRWFRSLGAHVRVHGHTADGYREAMGLCRGQALTDTQLSAAISARQLVRFERDLDVQRRLAAGREALAGGRGGRAEARAGRQQAPGAVARQAAARSAGRATRLARQHARIDDLVSAGGFASLDELLRSRYSAGGSLESLAQDTGLGRVALRTALLEAGVRLRTSGRNTVTGRRSRARAADTAAAERVSTEDLLGWLVERRAAGWTLTRLGDAVGHSSHWVRWRLELAETGNQTSSA